MEKQAAVNKLIAKGYDARLENSSVIVYHTKEDKLVLKKIEEELAAIGYDASYGIKVKKGTKEDPITTENTTTSHNYIESDGGQIGFDFSDF